MSSVAPPPSSAASPATAPHRQFVDEQIERTRRSLRWTDFATSGIGLLTALLAFLLVAAVLDHWVFRGGMGVALRGGLFALMMAGAAWYGWRTLAPLLRPINPAFAAKAIEQHAPSLKNSLLNLLMFRGDRQRMSPKVYDTIEQQAAERLALSDVDDAVDKSLALRRGYLLLGVAVLCALYAVLSPKNMATSASRVMLPWADIAAPSRVQILDVTPGDGDAARGEVVKIAATVTGAREDEPVTLHYRPVGDDGAATARTQSLQLHATGAADAAGAQQFDGQLPPPGARGASQGLQEPVEYWLEAGDGRTRRFRIELFSKPTIVVQQVRYEPPSYTGMPTSEAANTGDVAGLEGTRITISALANRPIRSAHIDFDADGTRDIAMQVDGDRATGVFTLALRDDRRTPRHKSYVLRFTGEDDRTNADPARYHIEVTADYAPTVEITAPAEPVTTVAVNQAVPIAVMARDLDFALSAVSLEGEADGRRIDLGNLLDAPYEGRFQGSLSFTPADAQLKPGQVLEYWAVALDNRRPQANVARTERQRLRIASPEEPPQDQQQPGEQPQSDEPQQDGDQGGQGNAQQDSDEAGEGNNGGGGGEASDQPNEGGDQADGGNMQQGADQQGDQEDGEGEDQGDGQSGAGIPGGGENGEGGEPGEQDPGGGGQSGQAAEGEQPQDGNAGGNAPNDGNQDQSDNVGDVGNDGQPSDGNQSNDGKPGEASADPVSSTGDDDATAFQRMAEHFAEQNPGDPSANGQQDNNVGDADNGVPPEADGDNSTGENSNGENTNDAESTGGEPDGSDPSNAESGANDAAGNEPGETGEPTADPGDAMNGERPEGPEGGTADSPPGGEGDEQFAEPNPEGGEPGAEGDEQQPGDAPSDATNPNQGAGGSGSGSDEPQATPDAGQRPQERNKTDRDPEGAEPQADEAPSGGQSKKESDSTGGQSGDQSGGGSQGAGQRANSEGEGAPGENTAADEGAGAAEQPGAGETGSDAGADQIADGQTGESSGDQPGAGSETSESGAPGESPAQPNDVGDAGNGVPPNDANQSPPGEQPNQQPGEQPSQQPGQVGEPGASDESHPPSQTNDAPAAGSPTDGGGGTAGGAGAGPSPEAEGLGEDEANLDFAQQQTDLILNRLDEQLAKQKVDEDLLKKLGWSADDLRKFVNRWKSLKAQAETPGQTGADAQVELDEALRSLGLRRGGPVRYNAAAEADELRQLQDSYRARAPREYQDRVRAYVRGAAAESDGE